MASRTFANWDFWHLKGNTHPKAFKGSEKDVENLGKHEKTLKKNFVFGEHPAVYAVCRTPHWHPSGSLKSCSEENSVGPHALARLKSVYQLYQPLQETNRETSFLVRKVCNTA